VDGSEIVVLSVNKKGKTEPVDRIREESEIVDIDLLSVAKTEEKPIESEILAYSTPSNIYLRQISPKPTTSDITKSVFTLAGAPLAGSSTRTKPQIRSVKLLTPTIILILVNLPFRKGVELQLVSVGGSQSHVLDVFTYHSPSAFRTGISAATALDILSLPIKTISAVSATQQILIGIATADLSVVITILDLSLHLTTAGPKIQDAKFRHYQLFSNTHSFPATKVAFSPLPSTKEKKELQISSVSASNTLVVHRLPMADEHHLSQPSGLKITIQILLFSLIFILAFGIGLELVFERRGKFPIREVWEDVVGTVRGSAKIGQSEYHRMEKMGKKLKEDFQGVSAGVKEGLKQNVVQGVLEGVLGMG